MSNSKEKVDIDRTIELNMKLEKFLSISLLVPLGEPDDVDCIWGLPVMLHGSPGIGKTARVRQASHAVGLECRTVELGGRQPEDASGAPFLTSDNKLFVACILGAVNELNAIGQGVLFFDELTCARPATQGAFLSAIQERRIGDVPFGKRVRVICAGNPPNESAGGYILQPPMANRMAHRDVFPPTPQEFLSYMINRRNRPEMEPISNGEQRVRDEWPEHFPVVYGLYKGYLDRFAGANKAMHHIPAVGQSDRGKAFATGRTNEYAIQAVTASRILGCDTSEETELFAACLGNKHAVNWEEWVAKCDLPSPENVLTHGWKPETNRLDKTMSVYSALAAYVAMRPSKDEQIRIAPAAWDRITDLDRAGLSDLAVEPAKTLVNAGLGRNKSPAIDQANRALFLKFGKLFEERMK